MTSPSPCVEPAPRRQQLARVHPAAWKSLLRTRTDLTAEALLPDWAERGWPLIARRRGPLDGDGVLLGLPLPPAAGKRRIAVEVRAEDLLSITPLPAVLEVLDAAPIAWRSSLRELAGLCGAYRVRAGVFGSLCWQWLTGLDYLSPGSDLDLACSLPAPGKLEQFLEGLAELDGRAPMRLDGELLQPDGAGANWRELRTGCAELAVKTADRLLVCARADFLGAAQ